MSEQIAATIQAPEGAPPVDATLAHAASIAPETAAQVQEEESRLQLEANKALTDCGRAFRRGEKAYRAGLFDAGSLAHSYVVLRLKLGAQRKSAIQAIEGELAKYSSSAVNANALILTFQAKRLLVENDKDADAVPYGHFRDVYARLVERVNKDSADETYQLLAGMEDDCRALFIDCTKAAFSREDANEKVGALVRLQGKRQAEKATQEREAKQAQEKQEQAAQQAAKANREAQEREAKAAQLAAEQAQDAEQKAALTAKMNETKEALRISQEKEKAANDAAEQAAKDRARAEETEKARIASAQKAQDKADKKSAPAAPKQPVKTAEAAQGTNILATLALSAKKGNVKDVADMLANVIMSARDPLELWGELFNQIAARFADYPELSANDALLAVVTEAKDNDSLSRTGQRAAQAALLSLAKRERSPSPAELASAENVPTNGQLVHAS